jgi:hypothetical protein
LKSFCQKFFFGGWNPNGLSRSIEASRCATKYRTMKPIMVSIGVMVNLLRNQFLRRRLHRNRHPRRVRR